MKKVPFRMHHIISVLALVVLVLMPRMAEAQCGPITTMPYGENFDSYTTLTTANTHVMPDCWHTVQLDAPTTVVNNMPQIYYSTTNSHSSTYSLRLYQRALVAMPYVSADVSTLEMELWVKQNLGSVRLVVGVMSDTTDASTFVPVDTLKNMVNNTYTLHHVTFDSYTGNGHYIAFRNYDTVLTRNFSTNYIDDIALSTVTSCTRPANLGVRRVTENSATVYWQGDAPMHQVAYGTSDSTLSIMTVADTFVSLSALVPQTSYMVKVKGVCGGSSVSDWSNTFWFSSDCYGLKPEDLPFTEDFSGYTSGTNVPLADCWHKGTNYTTSFPYPYNGSGIGDSMGLYFHSRVDTNRACYSYATLPRICNCLNVRGMTLRFDAKRYNITLGGYQSKVIIGVMDDPADLTTFDSVTCVDLTATPGSSVHSIEMNFSSYRGTGKHIAFLAAPPTLTGTSTVYNYIHIDNIELLQTPTCIRPTNVTVSDVEAQSASISWTPADSTVTNYVVGYGTDEDALTTMSVTGFSTTLSGLDPLSLYYVKVKSICGTGDTSEWSLAGSFTTLRAATVVNATHPYFDNFEGTVCQWEFLNGSNTNAWCLGSATNNGGSKAMYISNNNGASNEYTNTSTSVVFATKLFNLNAGTYHISYDWKDNGESTYDYMRVAMIPAETQLTPGTLPSGLSASALPSGWTALDGGSKLNLSSSWNNYAADINVPAANTYQIVFVWRNDASVGSNPPAAIDNFSLNMPTCSTPGNVVATLISTSSADVTWTAGSTDQSDFIVAYGPSTNPDDASMTQLNVTGTSTTLTGLTVNVNYNIYVRALCGGTDSSNWSTPATAYIGYCQPTPTSVDNQGITNVTFGSEGEVVNNTQRPTSAPYYGNYSDQIGAIAAGTQANVDITYQTNYTYGTIIWVDWDQSLTFDGDEVVYAGTSTSSSPTTLNATFTVPATQDTGRYRMRIAGADSYYDSYTASITAAANANPCPTSTYTIVHDYTLHVITTPSCLTPTDVAVSGITTTTASLSWSGTANSYTVAYGLSADTSTMQTISTTANSTTLTGLMPSTTYYVAVKAVCDGSDQSSWSAVASFATNCVAFVIDANDSIAEGFESDMHCWQMVSMDPANDDRFGIMSDAAAVHSGTHGFQFSSYSSAADYSQYLISPELSATTPIEVSLWHKVYGTSDSLWFAYSTTGNGISDFSNWTLLTASSSWEQFSTTLPANTKYIAVKYWGDYAYYGYLDDIVIKTNSAPVTQQYTLTVAANDSTMGIVTGSGTYDEGTTVTLMAMPNAHCHFVQWNDGDTNAIRTVTVTSDTAFTATFAADQYTLTVAANDDTMGTVTGSGLYNYGATVTLTATPNAHYHFVQWNDGDTNATRTVTVTANATYTATFAADQYTLTVVANDEAMGTVTGSGLYNYGATATLTATPNAHCHFVQWNDGDTNATRTVTVTATATYTATFAADQYTLTVAANDETMGTVTGSGLYNYGTTATLTATPNAHCHFVQWNDGDTNATRTVTVTANATYTATFAADQYTLTIVSNDETMGTVTGSGIYSYGATATLTATPNEGYRFVEWNDGDTNTIRTITVTADATYIATFEEAVIILDSVTFVLSVNDNTMGYTTPDAGTYTFTLGETFEATAYPNEGYNFVGWIVDSDTMRNSSLIIQVSEEMLNTTISIEALFERQPEGIDNADIVKPYIYSENCNIVVVNAAEQDIRIFDIVGRCLVNAKGTNDIIRTFSMSAPGIYLVKVGNRTAQKISVVR